MFALHMVQYHEIVCGLTGADSAVASGAAFRTWLGVASEIGDWA